MTSQLLESLKRNTRPQSVLGALGILLLLTAVGGHLYLLEPALAELRDLARARGEGVQQASESELASGAATIAHLEGEVATLRDRLYGEASSVPRSHMESWVIDRLDRVSGRHQVQLVSVAPEGTNQVLMFEELPYDVHVEGIYFDLFAWLHEVERELRPLVVKEFELAPAGGSRRVTMRLRLVSYRPLGAGT